MKCWRRMKSSSLLYSRRGGFVSAKRFAYFPLWILHGQKQTLFYRKRRKQIDLSVSYSCAHRTEKFPSLCAPLCSYPHRQRTTNDPVSRESNDDAPPCRHHFTRLVSVRQCDCLLISRGHGVFLFQGPPQRRAAPRSRDPLRAVPRERPPRV